MACKLLHFLQASHHKMQFPNRICWDPCSNHPWDKYQHSLHNQSPCTIILVSYCLPLENEQKQKQYLEVPVPSHVHVMYCPGLLIGTPAPWMHDERQFPHVVSIGVPPVHRMFVLYIFIGQEFLRSDPPLTLYPEFMQALQTEMGLVTVP